MPIASSPARQTPTPQPIPLPRPNYPEPQPASRTAPAAATMPGSEQQRLDPKPQPPERAPRAPKIPDTLPPIDAAACAAAAAPAPVPEQPTELPPVPQTAPVCGSEAAAWAREALACATSERGANVAVGLAQLISQFTAPAVAAVLAEVPRHSQTETRLLLGLAHAFISTMNDGLGDVEDVPVDAIAVYLLQRCSWDAICEPRLFDKLQLLMRGEVTAAFLAAEAQDAAAARAVACQAFAGVDDAKGLVEQILARRRLQFWDSFLQVRSAELLRDAIDDGDFGRVESLLSFAPNNSAETAARIVFDTVGPGDKVLPELRRFCAERNIHMPMTLQAPPDPIHWDYMDALLQRVTRRGLIPDDVQFFWQMLEACDTGVRERLLRADLDNTTAGELTVLLTLLPAAQVTSAFPQAMLAQLLQTYSDRFECPLLGFGTDFAARLVQTLPQAQVEALVQMKSYIVIHDMLEVGQWSILGSIVQKVGPAVADEVLKILRAPLPPRDEHFQTDPPVMRPGDILGDPSDNDADGSDTDSADGMLPTLPDNPTRKPPPIAFV